MGKLWGKIKDKLLYGYLSKVIKGFVSYGIAKLLMVGASQVPGLAELINNPEFTAWAEAALTGLTLSLIALLKRKFSANSPTG